MNALQVFSYNNNPVSFKDESGQVYINATEMAKPFGKRPTKWLELPSTQELIKALEEKDRGVKFSDITQSGSNIRFSDITSKQLIITVKGNFKDGREQGTWLHEDIALDFAQWLSVDFKIWCNDRIKELMRYGITASDNMINQMLDDPDMMIGLLTKLKEERLANVEQAKIIEQQQTAIEQQAPKVAFANAVATSHRSCLVGELATILKQNGVNIGQNRLFAWMRGSGYLCATGERYNQPTQKSMDLELFEIKKTSISKPDGTVLVTSTTKVTGKGQIYFVNKLINQNIK